jgi:hypothetical protein
MAKELLSLHQKGVFEPLSPGQEAEYKPPIPGHFFFKEKFTPDGVFDKLKGRLVAGGHMQDRDSIFEKVSSPTAALPFVLAVSAIAAQERRHVYTADIPTAYLNADNSSHNITMRLDKVLTTALCDNVPLYKDFMRKDGTIIVKLRRALYGCIESARLWYNTLRRVLEADGYVVNSIEPCIFNKMVDGVQCTIVVYVDDLMLTCKSRSVIEGTLTHIGNAFESELTIHNEPKLGYLGMMFDFSQPGIVGVTMPAFVNTLMELAGTTGTASSPAGHNLFNIYPNSPLLETSVKDRFHSMVARILYLAKRTRADLLLTVSFLTTRVQAPTEEEHYAT